MAFEKVEQLVADAVKSGVFPGAAFAVSHKGKVWNGSVGQFTYCPESPHTTVETIFDMASCTKVVAGTTMAMKLWQEGVLDIDKPVVSVIPEFGQNGKEKITFRNLLVHNSGLIAGRAYHNRITDHDKLLEAVWAEKLVYPTGTKSIYSDLSLITLGIAMERLSGIKLDAWFDAHVAKPTKMTRSGYFNGLGKQVADLKPQDCAPTENVEPWRTNLRKLRKGYLAVEALSHVRVDGPHDPDAGHWIQGEVHDPTAMLMGGVSGNAGLFSCVNDVVRFMSSLLDGKIVKPETVAFFTKKESDLSSRALGWDTASEKCSAGSKFSKISFGHTGYTGTCIWCDPTRDLFATLLTNRVHPTASNTAIIEFRPKFHNAIIEAIEA